MLVLEVIGGVVVLVGLAVLLAGRSDPFPDEPVDRADPGLPGDRPLRSSDIPRLRFRVALRGYRMEDVDAALEAARAALQAAEQAAGQREVGPAAPAQAGPADEGNGAGGERHEGLAEVPTVEQPPPDGEDLPLSQLEERYGAALPEER